MTGQAAAAGGQPSGQPARATPAVATYTEEQVAVIRSPAPVVVVQALAGTGKSTTGRGYAIANRDKPILVLCFNRANAEEAKPKFGAISSRVVVRTTHSLAFRALPPGLVQRVTKRWGMLSVRDELPRVGGRGDIRTASIVVSLLTEFFTTVDEQVDPALHGAHARREYRADDESLDQCAAFAQRLWLAMNTEAVLSGMQGGVNDIGIPPDAYLKRFVTQGGNLGFHTVIFDEAQDANPIMLQLLKNQYTTGSKVIMLGDRHQSIYEYRGAVNAMDHLPDGAAVLPLTQSWRFGPRTAALANLVLRELKGERMAVQGMGADGRYDKTSDTLAYLSRTNTDLLARAVSVNGEGVRWVGGIENYRVGILNDIYALRQGRLDDIQDFYTRKHYRSWNDFTSVAEHDVETRILAELVENYGDAIPELVRNLIANQASATHPHSMDLSTVHRSKGLEFDFVKLCDDFRDVFVHAEDWLAGRGETFPEQEVHLYYVGITRARLGLLPNFEMQEWVRNLATHRANRQRSWGMAGARGNERAAQMLALGSDPIASAAPAMQSTRTPGSTHGIGVEPPRRRTFPRPGFISRSNVRTP